MIFAFFLSEPRGRYSHQARGRFEQRVREGKAGVFLFISFLFLSASASVSVCLSLCVSAPLLHSLSVSLSLYLSISLSLRLIVAGFRTPRTYNFLALRTAQRFAFFGSGQRLLAERRSLSSAVCITMAGDGSRVGGKSTYVGLVGDGDSNKSIWAPPQVNLSASSGGFLLVMDWAACLFPCAVIRYRLEVYDLAYS